MAAQLGVADHARLASVGIIALTAEEGLALFDAVSTLDRPTAVPTRLNTANFPAVAARGALPAILRDLLRIPRQTTSSHSAPDTKRNLARILATSTAAERDQIMLDLVRDEVAAILQHPNSASVEDDRGFLDMGFSSLMALELCNSMSGRVGQRLPVTLVFDYPTPRALARQLRTIAVGDDGGVRSVLGDLDRAAVRLAEIRTNDAERDQLTDRLTVLLAQVTAVSPAELSEATANTYVGTGDELFDFIDNQLDGS
jgi:pimaricinolide synthase PimS1